MIIISDITNEEELKTQINNTFLKKKKLDILINNAGKTSV